MTTTPNHEMTCTKCGVKISAFGPTRMFDLLRHMVNYGEITVGEAKAELESPVLDSASRELLAGWVLARWDDGDDFRATPPHIAELEFYANKDLYDTPTPGTVAAEFPPGSYDGGL